MLTVIFKLCVYQHLPDFFTKILSMRRSWVQFWLTHFDWLFYGVGLLKVNCYAAGYYNGIICTATNTDYYTCYLIRTITNLVYGSITITHRDPYSNNKLISQYLKTRHCKYYTCIIFIVNKCIMIQYYSFKWNKLI